MPEFKNFGFKDCLQDLRARKALGFFGVEGLGWLRLDSGSRTKQPATPASTERPRPNSPDGVFYCRESLTLNLPQI